MKTIITTMLAAASIVAASAMAEDLTTTAYFGSSTTQSSGQSSLSWDTSAVEATLTEYTLTLGIDLINLTSGGANQIRYANTTNSGNINIAIRTDDGSAYTLYICNGGYGSSSVLDSISIAQTDTLTIAVADGTMTVTTSLGSASVDVSSYNMSITSGATTLDDSGTQGLRIYSFTPGTVSYTSASITGAAAAVAVPEPATATLSLLALAGLAARRRRK